MKEPFKITPYAPEYEEALLELERMSPQGYLVKLQTVRDNFLSRATVFEAYQAYMVLGQGGAPVACAIGAKVPIQIAGQESNAGYGFSARVAPRHRNIGLGGELARYMAEHFFEPNKLQPQFTTLRTSNMPMLKLLLKSHRNTYQYEFSYMTFSTARGVQMEQVTGPEPAFHVDLLSCHDRLTDYYEMTDSGIGLWKTHKLYQLKISSISPLARAGFWMDNLLHNNQRILPDTDVVLKTVTLFNLNRDNIHTLPAVALRLYKEGISYMQVCCQPNDLVYKTLYKRALNIYSYFVVSTQPIRPDGKLTLDVRCL